MLIAVRNGSFSRCFLISDGIVLNILIVHANPQILVSVFFSLLQSRHFPKRARGSMASFTTCLFINV